jgi:hypothetical protein
MFEKAYSISRKTRKISYVPTMVKIKAAATDEITARTIIALDSHNILSNTCSIVAKNLSNLPSPSWFF